MDIEEWLRDSPAKEEPNRSESLVRRTCLEKGLGAGRNNLPTVGLELSHKRPCRRTVSLADKEDDRRHPIGTAPAFIAGEIEDLNVAINLGGAVRMT